MPPSQACEPPSVSASQVAEFHRNGFLVLPQVTTAEDVERIARLLARLYGRYHYFTRRRRAHDLAGGISDLPQILEINRTLELVPSLKATLTFARCQALAETLLGKKVEYRFDHTIYKPAYNGAATAWHQDEVYTLDPRLVTAHFWVPLHDVSVERGCMHFIPGSHLQGIRPHRRLNGHTHVREAIGVDPSGAVACPLRVGDATVHVPRTLHYTGPNLTPWPRMAWSLEFGPRRGLGFRLYAKTKLVWRKALGRRRACGMLGAPWAISPRGTS
jgi:ectoine hydroxylase-related dioxygenase (phytanoyl-CoA dioxygenase family)